MKKPAKIILIVFVSVLLVLACVAVIPFLTSRTQIGEHVYRAENRLIGTTILYGDGVCWEYDPHDSNGQLGGLLAFDDGTYPENNWLKRVIILEGVTYLTANTFHNCANLEEVYLPASLGGAEDGSFDLCPGLKRVYFSGDAPNISIQTFGQVSSDVFYHTDLVAIHKTGAAGYDRPVWNDFLEIQAKNFLIRWI